MLFRSVALDKNNLYIKTHARFGNTAFAIETDYYYKDGNVNELRETGGL